MVLKEKDNRIIKGIGIQQYVNGSSFAVHNSKGYYKFIFISVTLCFGLILYLSIQKKLYPFSVWFCSLYCIYLLISCWKSLKDSKPKLVLSKDGIALRKFGFVPWNAIREIKIRNNGTGESSSTLLDIFLTNTNFKNYPDCSIEIEHLNKDTKQIKEKIKEYSGIEPSMIGFW